MSDQESTAGAMDEARARFREGVGLAASNMPSEALGAFRDVVERWPDHDLADDALYNAGACYLATNQFQRAADAFHDLVKRYPEATICEEESAGRESGRTAAKAWLGIVSARLGLGDLDGAREACKKLESYDDSRVHPAPGIERTFHDVAESLLHAAVGDDAEEVDEVSPADCSEDSGDEE